MPGPAPIRRMTLPTLLVLHALLDGETYSFRICEATGLKSGSVTSILARLAALNWLGERWEDINPTERGRPPRHYYRLTDDGAPLAREAVERATKTRKLGLLIGGRS